MMEIKAEKPFDCPFRLSDIEELATMCPNDFHCRIKEGPDGFQLKCPAKVEFPTSCPLPVKVVRTG